MPMLPAPLHNLESPSFTKLTNYEQWPSIPLQSASIPLGCGVIELPYCAECFSSVSCKMHSSKAEWSLYTSNKSRLSKNTLNYILNLRGAEKRIDLRNITNLDSNFSIVIRAKKNIFIWERRINTILIWVSFSLYFWKVHRIIFFRLTIVSLYNLVVKTSTFS